MSPLATLNRSLIAIYFKQDFLDLIKPYLLSDNENPNVNLEDLNEDPILLMVPPMDEENAENDLKTLHPQIAQTAFDLYLPEETARPILDKGFQAYFDIDFFEEIYDLASDYELAYEEDESSPNQEDENTQADTLSPESSTSQTPFM